MSASSCGTSWRMLTPTIFQAKEASQAKKAVPITMPSARLWKKSPKSTGKATRQSETVLLRSVLFSAESSPFSICTSMASGTSVLQFLMMWPSKWLVAPISHPPSTAQPHAAAAPASDFPTARRWFASGKSRNTAAANKTPAAPAFTKCITDERLPCTLGQTSTSEKIPRRVGSMETTPAPNTSPMRSVEPTGAGVVEHPAADSSTAASISSPWSLMR
mmetsp:Transcript_19965/g.47170  ORF Transcript_19965/g.47170 Transcript_19965/m.47170 type:complete len:218 (+) Transcript_19965:570-1223(+)